MKKVLITAGPTRAYIDAIRYISNTSSGRLGVEIAKEAYRRGFSAHLIYGAGSAEVPDYILTTHILTVDELLNAVIANIIEADVFISAAAVLDYAPKREDRKIRSGLEKLVVNLYPTPKIVEEARKRSKQDTCFVTFKLGYNLSEDELISKAKKVGGDIIVANDISKITEDNHPAVILYSNKIVRVKTKKEIAEEIFNILEDIPS